MSATEFSPDRSAALRELLLTTVREEPKRQRRLQILLTSILSAVAIVLAGGTAALALTGVIHFGDDAPAPAPAPTSTVTPTHTPTPTPTPSLTRPIVQSGPIAPHDVDSLPASTRWALDLPGEDTGCTGVQPFTLSDGRALYLSGQRPKEYESDTSPCPYQTTEDVALTLVDTQTGDVVWTREWKFTTEHPRMTDLMVLGTSGRAVISYGRTEVGPHEVLDLTTGAEVAPFTPTADDALRWMVSVPGDSGDVVAVTSSGDSHESTTVSRIDPRDSAHPRWSTDLGNSGASLGTPFAGATTIPVTFYTSAAPDQPSAGSVSLDTGEFFHEDGIFPHWYDVSSITLRSVQVSDETSTLIAQDADGGRLWTKDVPRNAMIGEIHTADRRPGREYGYDGTGLLAITDESTLTVVDASTGETEWTVSTAGCKTGPLLGVPETFLDDTRDAYVTVFAMSSVCTMARSTGEQLDEKIPFEGWTILGTSNTYGYENDFSSATEGAAYDRATGDVLWTRLRQPAETWSFEGGYLVSRLGYHIESIG
jgi:hypothetical protein